MLRAVNACLPVLTTSCKWSVTHPHTHPAFRSHSPFSSLQPPRDQRDQKPFRFFRHLHKTGACALTPGRPRSRLPPPPAFVTITPPATLAATVHPPHFDVCIPRQKVGLQRHSEGEDDRWDCRPFRRRYFYSQDENTIQIP